MSEPGAYRVLMVVEDDPDIRILVQVNFRGDPSFSINGECSTAEEALELAEQSQPDLIVLDHKLEGEMTGLEAAPLLKERAPRSKIILFSASEELREPAHDEPAVDAFLLKTNIDRLVGLARKILDAN